MSSRPVFSSLLALFLIVATGSAGPGAPEASPVLGAMKAELTRSFEALKMQPTPPYFLSYELTESQTAYVTGSFGTLTGSTENRHRQLDIDLRVGDYTLDNTREIRGEMGFSFDFFEHMPVSVSIEDDPDAIRAVLWYHTDRQYKRAVERLTKVKTNVQLKVEQEDKSDDFSKEKPEVFVGPPQSLRANRKAWEEKVRKYTAPFARYGHFYEANASLSGTVETQWFVNSEGTTIQASQGRYRLMISAFTKANDGMELPRYESFFSYTEEGLPDDATVLAAVEKMIRDLNALRRAPVVDPYAGPAVLSGRASGVFFHEVLGHRIEGHRQKESEEGQTFKKKIGEKVLPETFSVYFDPTQKRLGGAELAGAYEYDNQGVKARRVAVIEKGVLKSFLMSRTPVEGFAASNGHGRKQAGFRPVARQSNLIVEARTPVSRDVLKKMLIEQVKKEGKPFGLMFEDIQGGFTMTGRTIPNAFNVLPILVYRIYVDGREELVRGVDLIGTPLTAFSRVTAADNQVEVFNGVCGAESGGVPVSAASPAVLLSQVEVQKKEKSQERPPLLPPPFEEKKP